MSFKPRNVAELLEGIAAGEAPDYLYFWGHTPSRDGSVTKSCFSQWWEAPFEVDGLRYLTAEHFMMAGKARLFGDEEMLGQILESETPAEAKKLGRSVRGFDDAAWRAERFGLVVAGNVAKFAQHAALGDYLRGTGERVLVEASPRDRIWGIGMGGSNPDAADPAKWRGLNLLGFSLMEARDRLR